MSQDPPNITLKKAKASSVKADVIVIGTYPDGKDVSLAAGAEAVDHALGGRLAKTLGLLGATGRVNDVTLVPTSGAINAPVVAAVGLGGEAPSAEDLRCALGATVRRLAERSVSDATVACALPAPDAAAIGAIAEGIVLGGYRFTDYRSAANGKEGSDAKASLLLPIKDVIIVSDLSRDRAVKDALAAARAVSDAVNLARDLINTPPLDLPPAEFVNRVKSTVKGRGLQVEVWDEKGLAKDGYGGILGVGKGSTQPPRLLKLTYRHPKAKRHLALVGKGITFDTGGLSLKPADAMTTMKCDMSGAAAVVAAIGAVAQLGLAVDVTVWAALAENMPSGSAIRPSDVLTIYGGKTVEVLNTDAEGRLVLADALVRASEDKPDLIVDVATLTGACVVGLGNRYFGIFGSDGARDHVQRVATEVGELGWPLPIPDGTKERLDSRVADLTNVARDRQGGALVAAAFLREFVGTDLPWAHLDIAGPAFNDGSAYGYTPRGGTGNAVRTLVGLATDAVANPIPD